MKKELLNSFFKKLDYGNFVVKYWDGEEVNYGEEESQAKIIFNEKLPVSFALDDPILNFGEFYMDGLIDFEGDLEEIIKIMNYNQEQLKDDNGISDKLISGFNTFTSNIKEQQKEEIQHHYDLGNDFFFYGLMRQ